MIVVKYTLDIKSWANVPYAIIEKTVSPSGLSYGYIPLALYNGECFEVIDNRAHYRKKINKALNNLPLTCKLGKYYLTL